MGLFSGIERAKVTNHGNWLPPDGDFLTAIDLIKVNSGFKGTFFIVELKVLDGTVEGEVGKHRSWMANLSDPKKKDMSLGDIKSFYCALKGLDPATQFAEGEIDEKLTALVEGKDSSVGKLVRVRTKGKQPKADQIGPDGKPLPSFKSFTYHNWYAATAEEQGNAAELIKLAGFAA